MLDDQIMKFRYKVYRLTKNTEKLITTL